MFKVGQMVVVGNKTGTIVKILKNSKYKIRLNFGGNLRYWNFSENEIEKIRGYFY